MVSAVFDVNSGSFKIEVVYFVISVDYLNKPLPILAKNTDVAFFVTGLVECFVDFLRRGPVIVIIGLMVFTPSLEISLFMCTRSAERQSIQYSVKYPAQQSRPRCVVT